MLDTRTHTHQVADWQDVILLWIFGAKELSGSESESESAPPPVSGSRAGI